MSATGVTLKPDYSRIVSDNGDINIASISVANRNTKYFSDIITTLIDIQWRWNLLLFFGSFTFTWVAFAAFYHLLSYVHGDQFEQPEDWLPCMENVNSYTSALLFSIETMSTIGYGSRYVTEACPGAYVGVIAQSILGAALQFALAGLVVAKVKRAKKRRTTILFSKEACIYAEDLKLRLAIRIGDMRKSDIIGAHICAYFIRKTFSKSGDKIPVNYFNMEFKSEGGNSKLFLPWPTYIIHNINEDSPLYNLSRDDAISENFELIVELEGVASSLSQSFQVRKSYHPWEIKWGHRFLPLGHTCEDMFDGNIVDYENFHETKPVNTPMVSAKDIDEMSLKGDLSPEKLQRRRDSRGEINLFMGRRKSVTDTFLGAESELSESEMSMSMSDTMSMDQIRRISTTTYHGPGTFDRRKSVGTIFGLPVSTQASKTRRHSTGQFLEHNVPVRTRRISKEGPLVGNVAYHLDKEKSVYSKVMDIKSETHEESGPRYTRNKKRVTLNPNPITGPLRKVSDPGVPTAPLCSVLQKRRRHSTWQFVEQDAFIKNFRRLNPEEYLRPHLEVAESEESDHHDSNHGGDEQRSPSPEEDKREAHDFRGSAAPQEEVHDSQESTGVKDHVQESQESAESKNQDHNSRKSAGSQDDVQDSQDSTASQDNTPETPEDAEEGLTSKRVVYGSYRKKYVIQKVPEIVIDKTEESSTDEDSEEEVSPDSLETVQEQQEHVNSSCDSDEDHGEYIVAANDTEQDNLAFMYDSEDDIGYSRHIVNSDDEEVDFNQSQVNHGYESDEHEVE